MTGLALIGVGMVAGTYADAIAGLNNVRLIGAMGARAGSGAAWMERHGIGGRAYASVDEIAGDHDVDAVLLTTPPDARVEIVETLARAGKPILMEKPVERTLGAARALVETCARAGVPLGIMLQHRARPSAAALRERREALGPLRVAEISVPWWRGQGYYDTPGRGTYARDGGGVMLTQAIHTLDLALQFTGPVTEVQAITATTGFHLMEAEDFVAGGLRFANGAVGSVVASTASFPGRGEEIVLHCAHGSAHLTPGALVIDWQSGGRDEIGGAVASGAGADPMAFTSDWHRAMIVDFLDAAGEGRDPLASGASALQVHALVAALEQSGKRGQVVRVEDV